MRIQSLDFPDEEYFHIEHVPDMLPGSWGNYIRGAVLSLARFHKLRRGFHGIVQGKLPMGGLSSSAAVTTAYLLALCDVNDIACSKEDIIQLSHWVEKEFIGLNNGILDQSANVLSRDGYLMAMDCETNEWQLIEKGHSMPDFEVVIVNSGFTKALMSTDYNNRVDECKIAASILEEYARGKTSSLQGRPAPEPQPRGLGAVPGPPARPLRQARASLLHRERSRPQEHRGMEEGRHRDLRRAHGGIGEQLRE